MKHGTQSGGATKDGTAVHCSEAALPHDSSALAGHDAADEAVGSGCCVDDASGVSDYVTEEPLLPDGGGVVVCDVAQAPKDSPSAPSPSTSCLPFDALPEEVVCCYVLGDFLRGSLLPLRRVSHGWNVRVLKAIAMRGSLCMKRFPLDVPVHYDGTIVLKFHVNLEEAEIADLSQILHTNDRITKIQMHGTDIACFGAKVFADVLCKKTNLTSLLLERNLIDDEGVRALAAALRVNSSLSMLFLGMNSITYVGAKALGESLCVNNTLTRLELRRNQISDAGAQALGEALCVNTSLTYLELRGNQIGDVGAQALGGALQRNSTLTSLNLGNNDIGQVGASAIAEGLRDTPTSPIYENRGSGSGKSLALEEALCASTGLTFLDLRCNHIRDAGAESLSNALTVNTSLTHLDLANNDIGVSGAQALGAMLRVNTALTHLRLSHNQIVDAGAKSLALSLRVNTALTTLDVSFNQISKSGCQALRAKFNASNTLKTLKLGNETMK
jgi:Ran GTPase-activating protein (RanGAP) involved in mRNA processing and transport